MNASAIAADRGSGSRVAGSATNSIPAKQAAAPHVTDQRERTQRLEPLVKHATHARAALDQPLLAAGTGASRARRRTATG